MTVDTFRWFRRRSLISMVLYLSLGLAVTAIADVPVFSAEGVIQNYWQEFPGDESGYTAPCIGDWDGDGDFDILIGTYTDGPVYLFLNEPEGNLPYFELEGQLEADGEVISAPYD